MPWWNAVALIIGPIGTAAATMNYLRTGWEGDAGLAMFLALMTIAQIPFLAKEFD